MNTLTNTFQELNISPIIENILEDMLSIVITTTESELSELKDILSIKTNYTIVDEPTLKSAHIFCLKSNISPQVAGSLIERYIITNYQMTKNNASNNNGDANLNGIDYEIKVSFGGKDRNKFNYVQLRTNHKCSYILTAYYLCNDNVERFGELFVFKVDKTQMINLIYKYGAYAHGTKKQNGPITIESLNSTGNLLEYALRVKYANTCWNDLLAYRIEPSFI